MPVLLFAFGITSMIESDRRRWAEKGDELHAAYGKGPEVNEYLNQALEASAQ